MLIGMPFDDPLVPDGMELYRKVARADLALLGRKGLVELVTVVRYLLGGPTRDRNLGHWLLGKLLWRAGESATLEDQLGGKSQCAIGRALRIFPNEVPRGTRVFPAYDADEIKLFCVLNTKLLEKAASDA